MGIKKWTFRDGHPYCEKAMDKRLGSFRERNLERTQKPKDLKLLEWFWLKYFYIIRLNRLEKNLWLFYWTNKFSERFWKTVFFNKLLKNRLFFHERFNWTIDKGEKEQNRQKTTIILRTNKIISFETIEWNE